MLCCAVLYWVKSGLLRVPPFITVTASIRIPLVCVSHVKHEIQLSGCCVDRLTEAAHVRPVWV